MTLGVALHPLLEVAVPELDHPVAARAHQVVVVVATAESVAQLAGVVRERIDGAALVEKRECPVDGGETDVHPAAAQAIVDLRRGRVVCLARQLLDDQDTLRRVPDAVGREEGGCLLGPGHLSSIAAQ